jgi:hypothetical protein
MLSLSVSCIHLELSAAKSLKEQALLVLSMILFQGGRKMAELCAMRMELDYAFVEFPLFSRGLLRVSTASRARGDVPFLRSRRFEAFFKVASCMTSACFLSKMANPIQIASTPYKKACSSCSDQTPSCHHV